MNGFNVSWRGIKLTLLGWIAMLGVDLFLHGGVLSGLYLRSSPFLLPPMDAFRRIPIGYAGFLVAAGFLAWVETSLDVRGWQRGAVVGAVIGGVMWLSLALGLYSITTARPDVLVGWTVGQTLEMAYAGAFVGWGLSTAAHRRAFVVDVVAALGWIILTILLQSTGIVPGGVRA